jgi:hypothetical protein
MSKPLVRWCSFPLLLVLAFALGACNKSKDEGQPDQGPGPGNVGGPGGKRTPIHDIMVKLAKGPQSLTPVIGQELNADPPPWEQLQSQTKEYAELVSSVAKHDPPKGTKESWTKLTTAFNDSALALDQAIQRKDKEAALAAHKAISSSCMACHREHKSGPGGGPPRKGEFGPPGEYQPK